MKHFNQLPEFEKDFKRLERKYPSLLSDLSKLEKILLEYPTGIGNNFEITHDSESVKIVKTRLSCGSLRKRSMRVIYAYHNNTFQFMYIEIYFKGDKENENRERINKYLKKIK